MDSKCIIVALLYTDPVFTEYLSKEKDKPGLVAFVAEEHFSWNEDLDVWVNQNVAACIFVRLR